MLLHDGTGFDDGEHPAVLIIRHDGKSDRPLLSVVGNLEESISFHLDVKEENDPLANIPVFPTKN